MSYAIKIRIEKDGEGMHSNVTVGLSRQDNLIEVQVLPEGDHRTFILEMNTRGAVSLVKKILKALKMGRHLKVRP